MESGHFTGRFLKPSETFTLQQFNHVELNRLLPEILLGFVVVAAVGLMAHFVLSALRARRRDRGRP